MVPACGHIGTDEKLSKVRDAQHPAKRRCRLLKNLASMRHEQQTCLPLLLSEKALEVECCDDCSACAGRRDDEIPPDTMHVPFHRERVEDPLLKRVRFEVEEDRCGTRLPPRVGDGVAKDLGCVRVERREIPAVPVGFKFC